jgi:hypothetical protein
MQFEIYDTPTLHIYDLGSLNTIQVFWYSAGNYQGRVTIACFREAWTAYFNGMSKSTIEEFFDSCDSDYLLDKLLPKKSTTKDKVYLLRIINGIREARATQKQHNP